MRSSVLRSIIVLLACSVVGGGAAARAGPVISLLEMRQEKMIPQKWDVSCGAAALATILTYQFHDAVSERTTAEAMLKRTDPLRVKYRGGFSLLDLKRFAESRGYEADGYEQMTLEHLKDSAPLIIPISTRGNAHFVIFRGAVRDRIVLADPAYGNRVMREADFLKVWTSGLGFIVSRPGQKNVNQIPPRASDFVGVPAVVVQSTVPKVVIAP